MAAIQFVGKCFPTKEEFLDYLDDIKFGAWRPKFVTMHHTGAPNLKTWEGYGKRPKPITDAQWMANLAGYYGNEMKWSAGPHFFFTPKNFCVLSLPTKRGVHAVSFNASSWGVECVGDFDVENPVPELMIRYADGLACLHLAAGLEPDGFARGVNGLHFHRDDPKTSKTCPGKKIDKDRMVALVKARMQIITGGGAHDDDDVMPLPKPVARRGAVNVAANDYLNVRDQPSGKSPAVRTLHRGDLVAITGEVKNGETLWYQLDDGDYVSAKFVTLT